MSEDCSKTCPIPKLWDGSQCVDTCSAGTYMNPDRVNKFLIR